MSSTGAWAVADYDGELKPDRWQTKQEADDALDGKYLLSGAEVVRVEAAPETPIHRPGAHP
ncbi:MAG: hypothetical protein ABR616_07765 [Dermatophilaceae bacterium]